MSPFSKELARGANEDLFVIMNFFPSNQDICSRALNYIYFSYFEWRHDFIILLDTDP